MAEKRQAIIRVSFDLLAEALRLPPGVRVVDVSQHLYFDSGDVALKLEGECFEPVTPGAAIPQVEPQWIVHRVTEWEFKDFVPK